MRLGWCHPLAVGRAEPEPFPPWDTLNLQTSSSDFDSCGLAFQSWESCNPALSIVGELHPRTPAPFQPWETLNLQTSSSERDSCGSAFQPWESCTCTLSIVGELYLQPFNRGKRNLELEQVELTELLVASG